MNTKVKVDHRILIPLFPELVNYPFLPRKKKKKMVNSVNSRLNKLIKNTDLKELEEQITKYYESK